MRYILAQLYLKPWDSWNKLNDLVKLGDNSLIFQKKFFQLLGIFLNIGGLAIGIYRPNWGTA